MGPKLHLGCGNTILEGWINVDCVYKEGVDVVIDLNQCEVQKLPFEDNYIEYIQGNHFLEHIQNTLALMEELHRVAKLGTKAVFRMPYGSSDDAMEDPTHVRCYFLNSFLYFSQPAYWRADYGYRGDWEPEEIKLYISEKYEGKTDREILEEIHTKRNIVREMQVTLVCIKPIREANKALQRRPKISFIMN